MKCNLKSTGLIVALTTTILIIINPCLNKFSSNLVLAGATGLIIYLISLVIYNVMGELAMMRDIPVTIDHVTEYDDVMPIGPNGELFHYDKEDDTFQFVYYHPTFGLTIGYMEPVENENIGVHFNSSKTRIVKTNLSWENSIWAFFAQCPLDPLWDLYTTRSEEEIEKKIDEIEKEKIGEDEIGKEEI